jgi:hypothetical protein
MKNGGWLYRPRGFLYVLNIFSCTDKKYNKIFLIYKEIQMGSGAKSYLRKRFPIYEKMCKFSPYMRRPLVIYDFATDLSKFPYILGKF